MVGTTNKSMAAMSGAWLRRKVRHPWDGGPHRLTMYFATLARETSKPSLSNSPWMRGAPHSGLSTLIRRISAHPRTVARVRPRASRGQPQPRPNADDRLADDRAVRLAV